MPIIISDGLPLVEHVIASDIFCSGMAKIEEIGDGCFRFYLFARETHGDSVENVVVARVIMPAAAIPDAVWKAMRAMVRACGGQIFPIPIRLKPPDHSAAS